LKFTELGLVPEIVRAIAEQGYATPTPIQAQAIPVVLAGNDLMACAQTGTGKTAAFPLPILDRLARAGAAGADRIRVLILTPTRELAAQVEESVASYGTHLPFRSLVIFGGVNINPQVAALRKGVDILVATPGRLLDHAQQRHVDLSAIEVLVLDEADRMLDMGFIHDIRRVLALLPKKRQTLLFSATFPDEIRELASNYLSAPRYVESERRNTAPELVTQSVYQVDRERKRDLLIELIRAKGWHQVLVFTRTKWGANGLAEKLLKAGIEARPRTGRPPFTATRARTPARARSPVSRAASCTCSSPPTSRRAASTSTNCHRWSITSCPTSPRTTCTASAAPAARAAKVRPYRWSASTRSTCCTTSNVFSEGASP